MKGNFIRKYLPSLQTIPNEYVYEPWKAPIKTQISCQCIVGINYPERIINEKEIQNIFNNAQILLKKFHNVEIKKQTDSIKSQIKSPLISIEEHELSESKSVKNSNEEIQKNNCDAKEKSNYQTDLEIAQENAKIKKFQIGVDAREETIQLENSLLKNELKDDQYLKNLPERENLINTNNANDHFSIIHYSSQLNKEVPQMVWHEVNSKHNKLTYIPKCNKLENEKILKGNVKNSLSALHNNFNKGISTQLNKKNQLGNNNNLNTRGLRRIQDNRASSELMISQNITTSHLNENKKNTTICHIEVEDEVMSKSIDFEIIQHHDHKKIYIYSKKKNNILQDLDLDLDLDHKHSSSYVNTKQKISCDQNLILNDSEQQIDKYDGNEFGKLSGIDKQSIKHKEKTLKQTKISSLNKRTHSVFSSENENN